MNKLVRSMVLASLVCAVVPTAFSASNQNPPPASQGMQNSTGSTSGTHSGSTLNDSSTSSGGSNGSGSQNDPTTNETKSDSGGTKNSAPEPAKSSN